MTGLKMLIKPNNITEAEINICEISQDLDIVEDPRTVSLKRISYGIILPSICCLGIIGNILNLIVLTRGNMLGPAYTYMRGYSVATLVAILFCIPFALRVFIHEETGQWHHWMQAFYHVHLELYFGNACFGIGVMMLIALTIERYASVCHPGQYTRPFCGPPSRIVIIISTTTFLVYLPNILCGQIKDCQLLPGGPRVYIRRDNVQFLSTIFYRVYKIILEISFKVVPSFILAGMNVRIMMVYRESCERRRRMTLSRNVNNEINVRTFSEEKRLFMLLSTTSILFLICVNPMVILNVTLSEINLRMYSYQVFRALANLLEVINYSLTFYIYCLFSEDFRNTLIRIIHWPWCTIKPNNQPVKIKPASLDRPVTISTHSSVTLSAANHVLKRASV